jgi:peptidyl-tRNA hydrolase
VFLLKKAHNEGMENPILYVILNKSLQMSPGKAAAQAVHAAMMLEHKYRDLFLSKTRRTVIVLEASGREQLDGIADYLADAGMDYEYYTDEGVNEVSAFSLTALAVEPIDADDKEKRKIFESLRLFNGDYTDWNKPNQLALDALRIIWPFSDNRPWVVKRTIKRLTREK